MYENFRPGKYWYDNNAKLIQAHGGSLLFAEGKYWWYGENKENITGFATGEKCPYRQHGWKLYSSKDLYNWIDEGYLMQESKDFDSVFHPSRIGDRPHVLYNEKTKQYVMWLKTGKGLNFNDCAFTVCVGDSLKTLKYVKEFYPEPHRAGDFDLFVVDGKGYVVFEYPHKCMVLRELTEDFTDLAEKYSEHLFLGSPPFIRESPAFFERNGRKYILTSGTSSYFPNRTIAYDITDLHGEWKDLGETCVNDEKKNSFGAQYASVFKVPDRDLFIAIGDRWVVDLPVDMPDIEQVFAKMTVKDQNMLTDRNTSLATYVWLPITFDEKGTPLIEWKTIWSLDK